MVILLLLIFGVRGCLNDRKERALKNYVRDVSALAQESGQQSEELFGLLRDPRGQTPVELQNSMNGLRTQAGNLVDRGKGLDRPDEFSTAHDFLVEALEFRRDGIGAVATLLPSALGDEGRAKATDRIAAQMQNFLASDVIFSQRTIPNIQGPLTKEELLAEVKLPASQFLPDIEWLRPDAVADRIGRIRGGSGTKAAAPGLHGTGLVSVSVKPGGQALAEGTATEIRSGDNLEFEVKIANQGENTEEDVPVKVRVTGAGRPIEVEQKLDTIAAGETKTVTVPLAAKPASGQPATVAVTIADVPGEKKTDNNKGSFKVVFTGG